MTVPVACHQKVGQVMPTRPKAIELALRICDNPFRGCHFHAFKLVQAQINPAPVIPSRT